MTCYSNFFEKSGEFVKLCNGVSSQNGACGAIGIIDEAKPFVIHSLCEKLNKTAFVLTGDEASAVKIYENLSKIEKGVLLYPRREFNFLDVEGASREYEQLRLGVLSNIISENYKIVVASLGAAMQFTMPPNELKAKSFEIKTGDDIDLDEISKRLVKAGYTRFDQVDATSQFACRGGIIDIYSPGSDAPVRIELWGNTVDSITKFDIATQRRTNKVDTISIIPSCEVLFNSKEEQIKKIENLALSLKGKATKAREKLLSDVDKLNQNLTIRANDKYLPLAYNSNGLFDYIGDDLLFVCESAKAKDRCNAQNKLLFEDIKWLLKDGNICAGLDKFALTFDETVEKYTKHNAIYLDTFARGSFDTPISTLSTFNFQNLGVWSGTLSQLKDELFPLLKTGYTVVIMAGTSRGGKALTYDINEMGYEAIFLEKAPSKLKKGAVTVLTGTLTGGFQFSSIKFAVMTLQRVNQSKKKAKKTSAKNMIHSLDELVVGDYIVHNVHGIGVFDGIKALNFSGVLKDYIQISYAKGDTLYVPVTQLDLVSKYIGPKGDNRIKISRLGSGDWQKTKNRVRQSVQEMAKELISLYAKRMSIKGFAFSEDTDLQRDFELRFEYDETEDQLRCIDEIKIDMQKSSPMDRLLCGDVGFGKTEVALRAAFKCISEGKQCAILVPTTVLAMQHFQTAKKRMEPFAVNVEMLSRFVSPTKQKEILNNLKEGKVDLLIGTHRIISKDIKFNDLGLLIVDEEQRFGVNQKEKLKEKFPSVDVLTLSATPIPRTLNMAMSGIRDMSLLEEAPSDRYPVQTYVIEYDFDVVIEALQKELSRAGQCYYLHNDIDTINAVAMNIKKALPSATVGIAHGRMDEEQLSDVWTKLINGEIDILVCTTIIETGVDVPNVNTLIIENADRLGLAQLHQIRGRVGRSSRRAYAYFTFSRGKQMSEIATKRLETIREFTEFGSGFKIAMRDLEIRGAGSLLGNKQHGHIEAVGYDMYIKLLEEAVQIEKGEITEAKDEKECLIDLPINANIPQNYISSTPTRLEMYKVIANIRSKEDANEVYAELTDRFGSPPTNVAGLVEIALIRNMAKQIGVYEIRQKGDKINFLISDVKFEYLTALNDKYRNRASFSSGKKSFISVMMMGDSVLDTVREVIETLISSENKL